MDVNTDDDMPDFLLDILFRGFRSPTEQDTQLRADLQTIIHHRRLNEDRDSDGLSTEYNLGFLLLLYILLRRGYKGKLSSSQAA